MQRGNWTAIPRLAEPLDSWDQGSLATVAELESSVHEGLCPPLWISDPQPTDDSSEWAIAPCRNSSAGNESSEAGISMPLLEFVDRAFIPEYVLTKRAAGRAHFQAILKHILSPEVIAHAFRPGRKSKVRLKATPGWPYLDTMRLADVRPENVQRLVEASLGRGYSTQTAAHLRSVIRNIFAYATECGYYRGPNPAATVEVPCIDHKPTPTLSLSQLNQVIQFMRYPEQHIALFSLLTDMNVAEICGLKWKNVNLSNDPWYKSGVRLPQRTIAVKTQSYRGEYREVIGNRDRLIPINGILHSTLRSLRHRSEFTSGEDFVIASRSGTPVNPDNLAARRLKGVREAFNMPWLSWKVFHRTQICLMSQFGGSLNRELERVLRINSW
jgi:site-specific recombinase XerD